MSFKTGEHVTFISEANGIKKGDQLIYLWDTRSSGYPVALCIVPDDHYRSFMKNNNYYCITQAIKDLDKMSNVESLEIRLNCIKPYHNEITSKRIMEEKKETLEKELSIINANLSIINNNI